MDWSTADAFVPEYANQFLLQGIAPTDGTVVPTEWVLNVGLAILPVETGMPDYQPSPEMLNVPVNIRHRSLITTQRVIELRDLLCRLTGTVAVPSSAPFFPGQPQQ